MTFYIRRGDLPAASMIVSFTPGLDPFVHDLQSYDGADTTDVAMLVQRVKGTLRKAGWSTVIIHSHLDPKTDDSWYIQAGAIHDVTIYKLKIGDE